MAIPDGPGKDEGEGGHAAHSGRFLFENRELAFLRNVRLLYQDYLDGSPLHRSDTKASIQLLGNLALANLRRSHLRHLLRESRALDRLDLSRAGGLFGGALPLVQLHHAAARPGDGALDPGLQPPRDPAGPPGLLAGVGPRGLPRLAGPPAQGRSRGDLAARSVGAGEAGRWRMRRGDPPTGASAGPDRSRRLCLRRLAPSPLARSRRPEADAFLETVEFTAVDFLADDAERDAEIHARFGPQVAELVRRDRQQNVRRAFRSFPLHELPASSRTINPFAFYETHLAGGRVVLLPFYVLGAIARGVGLAVRSVYRVVGEILHPRVDQDRTVPPDTYWAALRKIHRMRKPVFMGSLWLRARFDVEYLGLPLPTAPPEIAAESMMEADLDYIGATRQDRIIAEQVRREHQVRLEWVGRWLKRFGWTFDELPVYLARELPYLANRGGEALRALVVACILDHDDIATLALSIEGLETVLAYAADPSNDFRTLPPGLPEPVVNLRALWHPVHRVRRPAAGLFDLPCFPRYDADQRRRIAAYLRRHRRAVRGWIRVVLGQGGPDPWETVRSRMRDVLLRTDLWSDQVLVLRAVQSLTMLDVQHNCELVWDLGGYTAAPEPAAPTPTPTTSPPIPPSLPRARASPDSRSPRCESSLEEDEHGTSGRRRRGSDL